MKAVKVITGIAILAALIAAVVVWFSSDKIKSVVIDEIESQGFTVINLTDLDLRPDKAFLSKTVLTHRETGIELRLTDLEIGFSYNLSAGLSINKVDLQDLEVLLPDSGGGPPLPDPNLLLEFDHAKILAEIPVKSVSIHNLKIGRSDNWFVDGQFSLHRLTEQALGLPVQLKLWDKLSDIGVTIDILESGSSTVLLVDNNDSLLSHIQITPFDRESRKIIFSGELHGLARIFISDYSATDSRLCPIQGHLRISNNPLDQLAVGLKIMTCTIQNTEIQNIEFVGHFKLEDGRKIRSLLPGQLNIGSFKNGSVTLSKVQGSVPLSLQLEDDGSYLFLQPDTQLLISKLGNSDTTFVNVNIETTQKTELWPNRRGRNIKLQGLETRFADVSIRAREANLDFHEKDTGDVEVGMLFPALELVHQSGSYELNQTQAQVFVQSGNLAASGSSRYENLIDIGFNLSIQDTDGQLLLKSEVLDLNNTKEGMAGLQDNWPEHFNLVSGTVQGLSQIQWQDQQVKGDLSLELNNVGGFFENNYFSGLTGSTRLEILPTIENKDFFSFKLNRLDSGLVVENIQGEVKLVQIVADQAQLELRNLSATVFGGTARIQQLTLNPDNESTRIILQLDDLALQELAGNQQFPGLDMEGSLSGSIPITITDTEIDIDSGQLHNNGPGVIRYDVGADDSGGLSGAEILFKALKRFEFSVLTVEPVYHSDGTLILKVHLEGISDEIGRQQPIHFNINLEQNVLSLFESIRLVNGLHEDIDQRVSQFYERRSKSQLH